MKVLIIEDEKPAAKHLSALINRYDPKIEILGQMESVKKSVEWFQNNSLPDLAFFDIQLADGLSFEIFEQAIINCPIIFTTAFNEYALKAFKVNSIDYLLKPIDYEELEAAINKFKEVRGRADPTQFNAVMDNVLNMLTQNYKQRFVIKVGEHIKSIPVENILYFYSLEKATYLHTSDDFNYVIDYSVEQLESLLDPQQYFRINRKYLIRIEAIEDIISYSNSRLKIELKHSKDMDAIVAREKVNAFKKWLDR